MMCLMHSCLYSVMLFVNMTIYTLINNKILYNTIIKQNVNIINTCDSIQSNHNMIKDIMSYTLHHMMIL